MVCKTTERIEVLLEIGTLGERRNVALDGGADPTRHGEGEGDRCGFRQITLATFADNDTYPLRYVQSSQNVGGLRRRIARTLNREISVQKFTDQQRQTLSSFSSVNYSPTHSIAFIRWLGEQKQKYEQRHRALGSHRDLYRDGIMAAPKFGSTL